MRVAAVGGTVPDAPRRCAAAEGSGGVKTPPYNVKDKRAVMARPRAGMPGPYGLLFPVQKFSKNNLANARIICYDNKLKTCSVPKGHGHIEQRESF